MPKGKYIRTAEIRSKISSARKVVLDSAKAYSPNLSTFLTSCLNIWRKNPSFILNVRAQKYNIDGSGFD